MSKSELDGIEREIKSELEPFFDGIRINPTAFKMFKEAYTIFIPKFERALNVSEFIFRDFDKVSDFERKEAIHELFLYLGIVESMGNCIVDMIVMLLIANGKDLHIESLHRVPRIRHVSSLRELEEERVPLGLKLRFLEDNGLKELTSNIDTDLRNDIAHLKFEIKKEQIHLKGKPSYNVVSANLAKLITAITATFQLLVQLAVEKGIK